MSWPNKINYSQNWGETLARARAEGKCVYLDFYTVDCIGCRTFNAQTYSDEQVAEFLNTRTLPLFLDPDVLPQSEDLVCRWTPYILLLDGDGKVHQRTYGFLPPAEFIPWLLLGMAKAAFRPRDWPRALALLAELKALPESLCHPEAIYLAAVARTRLEKNAAHLKAGYETLVARYPDSPWAVKARPYYYLDL